MNRTTTRQLSPPLAAVAVIAGLVAGAESASANTGKFKLGLNRIPPVNCKVGGPTDFRDAYVTNNTQTIFRRGRYSIYWQANIGGRIKSGKTRLWTDLGPGGTLSIPLGVGGGGSCQAKILRRPR